MGRCWLQRAKLLLLTHAKVAEMRTTGDFLIDVEYIIHRAGN